MIDFPPTNVKEGKVNALKIFFSGNILFLDSAVLNLFLTPYLHLEHFFPLCSQTQVYYLQEEQHTQIMMGFHRLCFFTSRVELHFLQQTEILNL